MLYKIRTFNEGRRIIAGSATKTLFDYLIKNNLNLGDFLCENPTISIPNSTASGLSNQTKYDYNDFLDVSGMLHKFTSKYEVIDVEVNLEIFSSVLLIDKRLLPDPNMLIELDHTCVLENPINLDSFNSNYIIFGEEHTDGLQTESFFESFNTYFEPKERLKFYHTVVDNTIDLVSKIEYDGQVLVNTSETRPTVRKANWFIQNNLTLERTRTQ
jgi:hypothetical protein